MILCKKDYLVKKTAMQKIILNIINEFGVVPIVRSLISMTAGAAKMLERQNSYEE